MKRSKREPHRFCTCMIVAGVAVSGAVLATNGLARVSHSLARANENVVFAQGDQGSSRAAGLGVLLASDDDARQPQSGLYDDRGLGEDHGPGNDAGPGEDYGPTSIGGTDASGTVPGPTPRMPSWGTGGGMSGGATGSAGGSSK